MNIFTEIRILVAVVVCSLGAMCAGAQGVPAAAPAKPKPYLPSAADFAAKIKGLEGETAMASLQLGPGIDDTVHLLFSFQEKKPGDWQAVLYWTPTVKGGLGTVSKVKGRASTVESQPGRKTAANEFKLPALTFQPGDLGLKHVLALSYFRENKVSVVIIDDSVSIQRGMQRSELKTKMVIRPASTPTMALSLWGKPTLEHRQKQMWNPPTFQPRVMLGPRALVMTGQGTAGPVSISVTELSATPTVTELESLDLRQALPVVVNAQDALIPLFVMKKAKPLTDYRVDFSCPLGPALGVVSNSIKVKTEQIINKAK